MDDTSWVFSVSIIELKFNRHSSHSLTQVVTKVVLDHFAQCDM